jgi:hypothetical protein
MAFASGWSPREPWYAQPGPWAASPRASLVAVTDACAIASSACHVARSGTASILVSLAATGRSNVFIGEDVEAELPEALARVAGDMGVALADAEAALGRIARRIRVVPLRVGDYLNPRIAGLRCCDPDLPKAMRGDPDDLGTAAVAAFLAPAVIISKDSVFNRFGLALPADRWTQEAARLLAAAGYDVTLADAAATAETAARLLLGGITAVTKAAARNPEATIAVMPAAGLAGWYCHRRGWITGEHLRAAGRRAAAVARPFAQRIAAADARRNEAMAALTVVEGLEPPSLEERCARHLARLRTAATPAQVAAILSLTGPAVTAEEASCTMAAHPSFTPGGEDGYILGRPAKTCAITTGTRPAISPPTRTRPSMPQLAADPASTPELPQAAAL